LSLRNDKHQQDIKAYVDNSAKIGKGLSVSGKKNQGKKRWNQEHKHRQTRDIRRTCCNPSSVVFQLKPLNIKYKKSFTISGRAPSRHDQRREEATRSRRATQAHTTDPT
jgi:hypothetical protein